MVKLPEGVMQGLVIYEPWIGMLLAGNKTWEMRSAPTSKRGIIGLIRKGSGHVVGIANLVDSPRRLNDEEMLARVDKHCIPEPLIRSGSVDKWRCPWVLEDVKALQPSVPYTHPLGAVTWVNLVETIPAVRDLGRNSVEGQSRRLRHAPAIECEVRYQSRACLASRFDIHDRTATSIACGTLRLWRDPFCRVDGRQHPQQPYLPRQHHRYISSGFYWRGKFLYSR